MAGFTTATGASLGSVFIKHAGNHLASFAEVAIFEGDSVARLAERASLKRGWNVDAAYVALFVVPASMVRDVQRDLACEADVLVNAKKCLATDVLAEAGICDRSCLLARLPDSPAAAPGGSGASDLITRAEAELISARAVARAFEDRRVVEAFNPFARSHHSDVTSPSGSGVLSPSSRAARTERMDFKRSVADFYGLMHADSNKLVDMLGVERRFDEVTLAHIWPASYGNFGDYAKEMALPADFHLQPRNFLLLDRELHVAFDDGRVAFLPSRAGIKVRVLRPEGLSNAMLALDGRALHLPRPGATPFKRTLGWFAWLAKGVSSCSRELLGELDASISASTASEDGNRMLGLLVEKAFRTEKIAR